MKYLTIGISLLILAGCFDKGGDSTPPPPPAAGTILTSTCDEYTLTEEVADGNGGSTTRTEEKSSKCGWNPPAAGTVIATSCDGYTLLEDIADGEYGVAEVRETERSPECGWDPPEAGTVKEQFCEEFTQVTVYHDGEYGTYEEREERSEECGYVPPVVSAIKEEGDRWDPVVFSYYEAGMPIPDNQPDPEVEVTLGSVELDKENGRILIRGAGVTGEGTMVVNGEEWRYTIVPEPRCGRVDNTSRDCMGYFYSGTERGYIYYGEDDDTIVEWELGWFEYTATESDEATGVYGNEHTGIVEVYEPGSVGWEHAQKKVDKYNEMYERSGVHIRIVLKEGYVGTMHYHGNQSLAGLARTRGYEVDLLLGRGNTCPDTCGCAYVNESFPENSNKPMPSTSRCGEDTDLHEIGHSVGLAHGPENRAWEANGYIWPDFGHGWEGFCSYYADIMSYETVTISHHNSTKTCGEMYADKSTVLEGSTASAGSRDYADAAYHLNRIRYDVSLIHCEGELCADVPEEAQAQEEEVYQESRPLIQDKVTDFKNGPERLQRYTEETQNVLKATPELHRH